MTQLVIAATGHRPQKLGGFSPAVYERLFTHAYGFLGTFEVDVVISGMALGWDTAVAEAALMHGMPLYAYIPFAGQESQWPPESQRFYRALLRKAKQVIECSPPGYSVAKMQVRNCRMVDDCSILLALWDGSSGGTANCIEYAESRGKEIVNTWERWAEGDQ